MEAEDREKVICMLRTINWGQFLEPGSSTQGMRTVGQDGTPWGSSGSVWSSVECLPCPHGSEVLLDQSTIYHFSLFFFSGDGHPLNTWSLFSVIVQLFCKTVFQRVFLSTARKLKKSPGHQLKYQGKALYLHEVTMYRYPG